MTQAEFNNYWNVFYDYANPLNDPGSVTVGPGSASFTTGQYFYIGISQSLSPGRYNLNISLNGVFDATHYFKLQSGDTLISTFTSSGIYSFPIDIVSGNIQLIWTGSDLSYTKIGSLYYIKLEAPQTQYNTTVYTIYGTVNKSSRGGVEAYSGELGGTEFQVTSGTLLNNPFLTFNHIVSSSNSVLGFSPIYYIHNLNSASPPATKTWKYTSLPINYPISIVPRCGGSNTTIFYKIDTSQPNYGTTSTSPSANSFTASNGNAIYVPANTYLSFACSSSTYIYPTEDNSAVALYESSDLVNPISVFDSLVKIYDSTI